MKKLMLLIVFTFIFSVMMFIDFNSGLSIILRFLGFIFVLYVLVEFIKYVYRELLKIKREEERKGN